MFFWNTLVFIWIRLYCYRYSMCHLMFIKKGSVVGCCHWLKYLLSLLGVIMGKNMFCNAANQLLMTRPVVRSKPNLLPKIPSSPIFVSTPSCNTMALKRFPKSLSHGDYDVDIFVWRCCFLNDNYETSDYSSHPWSTSSVNDKSPLRRPSWFISMRLKLFMQKKERRNQKKSWW